MSVKVDDYFVACDKLKVTPDAGFLCSLKSGASVLKPGDPYDEGKFLALMEFLISCVKKDKNSLPFTKLIFTKGKIGKRILQQFEPTLQT